MLRSTLQLADLEARTYTTSCLIHGRILADLAQALDAVAAHVNASKTEGAIALLNEGLESPAVVTQWKTAALAALLLLFTCALPAQARTFCMAKVHGKGGAELADPTWAEDYWQNGQFQSIAQPCGGMPSLTTHADGTAGTAVAFDVQYCGCGHTAWQGCDYLYAPPAGYTDPGVNAPWPSNLAVGWLDTNFTVACTRSGPYWPRQFPTPPRYQGVIEQINAFLDRTGCDDLTIVTHSNGANIVRWGFSMTNTYVNNICRQGGKATGVLDPGCTRLRQHQLRVINATTTVMMIAPPSAGSEAADVVQTLSGTWLIGWIAQWLAPYDRSTQELTTSVMATRNTNFLFGTQGRPWPIFTSDGLSLRVARWITLVSRGSPSQLVMEGGHAEDFECSGAAAAVPFPNNISDGLVSQASQSAVYTSAGDIWLDTGQHDQAASQYSASGNVVINHHHSRTGGATGGWWRPAYFVQEKTTPMSLGWPGPAFPAPGGPGGCSRVRIGTNPDGSTVDSMTCPTWPVPSTQHGLAVKACPDSTCLSNQTRGSPAGGDEAFWISAFIEARAAAQCGPPITNKTFPNGQWINYYRNTLTCGGSLGLGCVYGPSWLLAGQQLLYDSPYAPDAGTQVCQWQC